MGIILATGSGMPPAPRRPLRSGEDLPPFDRLTGSLHALVDTPKDSRNKFKLDSDLGLYKLAGVLPAGAFFPFDFGFVPSTLGEDGDPIDVLLLMDEPAFVGCLVEARLIGAIEAEQTEDGKTERNDRLIAVAAESRTHRSVRSLGDLSDNLVREIEHFFVSYNEAKGKRFEPIGRVGPVKARALVQSAARRFAASRRPRRKKTR